MDEESEISEAATARTPARATVVEMRRRPLPVATAELTDWILEAINQGATGLYLRADKPPSARIDGRIEALASEPLPMSMFERAGATMMGGQDGWRPAGDWAWSKDIPAAGNVHCQAFSDGRGGGFIVQLPVSLAGLEQQVPRHIRNACETGDGLIVVGAPFMEDVAAMVGAVVASSAERRPGFIVAFGAGAPLQSAAINAFVSERPLPSTDYEMTGAIQNALRERPDLLIVTANESVPAPEAIVSAAVGRLVIVGVVARTAPRAIEVLMKNGGLNRRAFATVFKGACSWRIFHRTGGRRTVVADSLLPNDHVRALIDAGDVAGLHATQNNREDGMRALDAALAAAVTRRKITLREAAAGAVDRKVMIALVRRLAREARAAERQEQRATHRAPVVRALNGA
jgi:Tfp pilus assembly ATPase PilU